MLDQSPLDRVTKSESDSTTISAQLSLTATPITSSSNGKVISEGQQFDILSQLQSAYENTESKSEILKVGKVGSITFQAKNKQQMNHGVQARIDKTGGVPSSDSESIITSGELLEETYLIGCVYGEGCSVDDVLVRGKYLEKIGKELLGKI